MNFLPKKPSKKPIIVSALGFLAVASLALAGSLTPPGAPAPTMNTLAELYDSIVGGFDSSGVVADQNGSLIEHLKYIEANMAASASAGGWTDDGTVVRLTTITDNVGIGTTTPNNRLQVAGLISFDDASFNMALGSGALISNTTGILNTAVGYQSLFSTTGGVSNTAVGYQSLYSNTIGTSNTAGGLLALYSNTTGSQNNAIGQSALYTNDTGANNTAVGLAALYANTTGSFNVAEGNFALTGNTTGSHNIAMGYAALGSDTGSHNIAIGTHALSQNTAGSYNTAVGESALLQNTGDDNVAVGASAGYNFTGSGGVFIGRAAGYSTTTGADNTAVGNSALFSNDTGSGNTAIGSQALFSNIDGIFNTATGVQAMYSNTSGVFNTANGYAALTSNIDGSENSAFGWLALYANTSGNDNTAVGLQALSSNTIGSFNTAVGSGAHNGLTTGDANSSFGYNTMSAYYDGSSNTAVGAEALRGTSGGGGSYNSVLGSAALYWHGPGGYNTALGSQALYFNFSGSDNVAVGASAGWNNNFGSGNVFLGRNAGYTDMGSNALYIENSAVASASALIYGEFDTNLLSFGGRASIAGNFGPSLTDTYDLGSSTLRWRDLYLASGSLHIGVSGDEAVVDYDVASDYLAFKPDGSTTRMVVADNGFVGIGTTSPNSMLSITSGTSRGLRISADDSTPYPFIINNLTHGSTDGTGFGLWQADDGSGILSVNDPDHDNGVEVAIQTNGRVVAPEYLGYIIDPSDNRHAISGIANITGNASLGSQDIVAAGGNISFHATSGTTDRALAGSYVTVTDVGFSGGTINNAIGLNGSVQALGGTSVVNAVGGIFGILASGSTNMTNAYGINISSLQLGDPYTGTVTNNYGLYINDQDGLATTLNYNVYSDGTAPNYFGGPILAPGLSATSPGDDYVCRDPVTGEITFGASCTPSSIRFKKNVENLDHGLDWVNQLRPVTFDWKHNGEPSLGFIAEEVNEVSPLLALRQDGRIFSVNYQIMTSVLAKAIQELDLKVETLAADGPMSFDEEGMFERFVAKLADMMLSVRKLVARDEICVGDTCLDEEQIKELLKKNGMGQSTPEPSATPTPQISSTPTPSSDPTPSPEETLTPEPEETPEPTPEINGSSDEPLPESAPEEPTPDTPEPTPSEQTP